MTCLFEGDARLSIAPTARSERKRKREKKRAFADPVGGAARLCSTRLSHFIFLERERARERASACVGDEGDSRERERLEAPHETRSEKRDAAGLCSKRDVLIRPRLARAFFGLSLSSWETRDAALQRESIAPGFRRRVWRRVLWRNYGGSDTFVRSVRSRTRYFKVPIGPRAAEFRRRTRDLPSSSVRRSRGTKVFLEFLRVFFGKRWRRVLKSHEPQHTRSSSGGKKSKKQKPKSTHNVQRNSTQNRRTRRSADRAPSRASPPPVPEQRTCARFPRARTHEAVLARACGGETRRKVRGLLSGEKNARARDGGRLRAQFGFFFLKKWCLRRCRARTLESSNESHGQWLFRTRSTVHVRRRTSHSTKRERNAPRSALDLSQFFFNTTPPSASAGFRGVKGYAGVSGPMPRARWA